MSQSNIDDYLYFSNPYRRVSDRYEITLCESSTLYKTLSTETATAPVRETYIDDDHGGGGGSRAPEEVPSLTRSVLLADDLLQSLVNRGVSYTACIQDGRDAEKHACDAYTVMIGGLVEKKILRLLNDMLETPLRIDERKREILKGAYIAHGCLYYSVFREVNNNTIVYEMGKNKEITFYMYDKDFNRGHKLFLAEKTDGEPGTATTTTVELLCNNRDGKIIKMSDGVALSIYYEKCTHRDWHPHISADLSVQIEYMTRVRDYSKSIDCHKNKRYICYAQSMQICFDKLNVFDDKVMDSCRRLFARGITFWGVSHTLNYEPSKDDHNKNYNKRMMLIKMNEQNEKRVNVARPSKRRKLVRKNSTTTTTTTEDGGGNGSGGGGCCDGEDEMGSAEHKNGIMYKSRSNKDQSVSSLFVLVGHSNLHNLRALQMTAQKLRVKHVYAASARNVSEDSFGYVCSRYVGNIGSAGKNMLFVDGVQISYGHEDLVGIDILRKIATSAATDGIFRIAGNGDDHDHDDDVVVTLNNFVTRYAVSKTAVTAVDKENRLEIVKIVKSAYKFAEVLFWTDGEENKKRFVCINVTPGVAFRKFPGLRRYGGFHDFYLSRTELEQFYETIVRTDDDDVDDGDDLVEATNKFLRRSVDREGLDCQSALAKCVDYKTDFTLPAKRSVAVGAYKSSLPSKSYATLARMTHKNLQIFVDPRAFEKDETLKNDRLINRFDLIRNVGGDGDDERRVSNVYYFNVAFGDVDGLNVEDAYVLDADVDLHLWCVLSYSLTFEEPPEGRVAVLLPAIETCVCVSSRRDGEPVQMTILLATVYAENEISFPVFKNVRIFKDAAGGGGVGRRGNVTYTVYAVVSDEVLVSLAKERDKVGELPYRAFRGILLETERFPRFKAASSSTTTSPIFHRRIDFAGVFKCKRFDGIKIVNAFGQKGLATARANLSHPTVEGPDDKRGDFVNLIANNCSLISRCAGGQLLQMKQNFPCAIASDDKRTVRGIAGRVPFFFTDNLPTSSTTPMRFDEMQKTTYVANSLPLALNVRANYNVNNVDGLCYPPDAVHVLRLYESIVHSSFRMNRFDKNMYTTQRDVDTIRKVFERYQENCQSITKCMKRK